ncbi:MAG: DUF4920 domain-containing protein [Ignavibacterium sp.]|jgi:hypothetical protein|uniref:DUF4920 domain-containing protein n=1 Tax=Ignavibacterium sp. TaxID=2651167 RepID=UPI003296A861
MIKQIFSLVIVISIISFAQTEKLGKEITLSEKTKISEITSNPEEFLGKTVLVEGEVLEVCAAAGCWMELKSDDGVGKIKIKVRDGDIVFPMSAKGKKAIVEGTVYKIELTKEEATEYYKHLAEESGKEFDPSTVTGPVTIYQIKGLGAEIN